MAKEMSKTDVQNLVSAIRSLENTIKLIPNNNRGSLPVNLNSPTVPGPLKLTRRQPEIDTGPPTTTLIKRQVFIRVIFLKIGEIDTINEKFAADVFIHGRWREPSLDNQTSLTADVIDWTQYWKPKLVLANSLKNDKEDKWFSLSYNDNGEAIVYTKQRITGLFLEYMELRQFPFDTQDLTITVTSDLGEHEIELLEDDVEVCGINRDSFVDMQEWHLHSSIFTWSKITTKVFQSAKHKHPAFSVACKVSRRPGFFIWNVIVLMLFICSLSFTIFAVNVNLIPNRLQLSFILLLTTVTFKFVVTHNLPKISYTTYLDKYILCSMIFLCCMTVWHVIAYLLDRDQHSKAELADRVAFYVLISLWICFQIFFFIWVAGISYYNKNILAKVKGAYDSITNSTKRKSIAFSSLRRPSRKTIFLRPAVTGSGENKVVPMITFDDHHPEQHSKHGQLSPIEEITADGNKPKNK